MMASGTGFWTHIWNKQEGGGKSSTTEVLVWRASVKTRRWFLTNHACTSKPNRYANKNIRETWLKESSDLTSYLMISVKFQQWFPIFHSKSVRLKYENGLPESFPEALTVVVTITVTERFLNSKYIDHSQHALQTRLRISQQQRCTRLPHASTPHLRDMTWSCPERSVWMIQISPFSFDLPF